MFTTVRSLQLYEGDFDCLLLQQQSMTNHQLHPLLYLVLGSHHYLLQLKL